MNSRARHVTNVVSFTNVSQTGGAVSRAAKLCPHPPEEELAYMCVEIILHNILT